MKFVSLEEMLAKYRQDFLAERKRLDRIEAALRALIEDPGSPHASAEKARQELDA